MHWMKHTEEHFMTPYVESQGKATYTASNRCIRGSCARWRGSETIFYEC